MLETKHVERAERLLAECQVLRELIVEAQDVWQEEANEAAYINNPFEQRVSVAKRCQHHLTEIEREIVQAHS